MSSRTVMAIALGSALALPALAAERRIKKTEVPGPVLAAVVAKYPKADMTGFAQEDEAGKTVYEVQLRVGGTRTELIVSPEGKILTEEKTISMKEFPDAVRQGLSASRYSKAKVIKIEKVTDSDKPEPTYELLVEFEKKRHELFFTSSGELTKEEAKNGDHED
ncbi:MAG: PepSY-like domain-containing protein [Myxococcaceae bacterium]